MVADPLACSVCGSDAIDEHGICHGCGSGGQL